MFALARSMSGNLARILMYHNFSGGDEANNDAVNVGALRSQFEYLRRHFRVVPLARLVAQLNLGIPLDTNTVALTIDDGRHNCYEFLFPLLKEFEIPATFFVVSSFIRQESWIWTDKVLWLAEQANPPSELSPHRIEAFFRILNQMHPEIRDRRIESISTSMSISIPNNPPCKYAPCSWNELREMMNSGLVDIGSHTVTHPILSSLTDEESWQELTVSRAQIEEALGRKINSFCFPNGKPEDYRPSHLQQAKDAGYTSAVITRFGMPNSKANPYELPRIGVSGESDNLSFAKYLDGVEHFQTKLLGSLRQGSV